MYQLDRQSHKHARLKKRLLWLLVILLSILLVYGLFRLRISPKQEIKASPSVSKSYGANAVKMQTFEKPDVLFQAPSGWKEVPVTQSVYTPKYMYMHNERSQVLEIFIDNPPRGLGINKAVVVSGGSSTISHDIVSDNCSTFTEASKMDARTGLAPAKWQEVDFICDMANSTRAVVGTISKDGNNNFSVTTDTGKHYSVFVKYTDSSINPNYSTLYDILKSMRFR
ncbi:hypothetical protein KA016_01340 [Candidatus Saccharibacteria bacterium]|nr:hypothetical protein [Candidatus Saccharibacteria bacterium]